MKDLFSKDIKVGDMVVYPCRTTSSFNGPSSWLAHGKVMVVDEEGKRLRLEGGAGSPERDPSKPMQARWIEGGAHVAVVNDRSVG